MSTFDLRHVVNQLTETVLQIQFVDYCQACFVVGLTSRGCRHLERCCSLYISFIMSLTSFERLKNTEARFPSSVIAVPAFTSSSLCRRVAEAANNTVVWVVRSCPVVLDPIPCHAHRKRDVEWIDERRPSPLFSYLDTYHLICRYVCVGGLRVCNGWAVRDQTWFTDSSSPRDRFRQVKVKVKVRAP